MKGRGQRVRGGSPKVPYLHRGSEARGDPAWQEESTNICDGGLALPDVPVLPRPGDAPGQEDAMSSLGALATGATDAKAGLAPEAELAAVSASRGVTVAEGLPGPARRQTLPRRRSSTWARIAAVLLVALICTWAVLATLLLGSSRSKRFSVSRPVGEGAEAGVEGGAVTSQPPPPHVPQSARWRLADDGWGVEACAPGEPAHLLTLIAEDAGADPLVEALLTFSPSVGCVRIIPSRFIDQIRESLDSQHKARGGARCKGLQRVLRSDFLVTLQVHSDQKAWFAPLNPAVLERLSTLDRGILREFGIVAQASPGVDARGSARHRGSSHREPGDVPLAFRLEQAGGPTEALGVRLPAEGQLAGRLLAAILDAVSNQLGLRLHLTNRYAERVALLSRLRQAGLVDVRTHVPDLQLEIAYASTKNFTGKKHYLRGDCFLLQSAAAALARVNAYVSKRGLRLKAWDCYRPVSVQRSLWKHSPYPGFVAPPSGKGSAHNHGLAIDLTLTDTRGQELEMPTRFDDFTERAHHGYTGDLTVWAIDNRATLRRAMRYGGFSAMKTEWWHYQHPGRFSVRPHDIVF